MEILETRSIKTALFIKVMPDFTGEAKLYRLNPVLEGFEYVVVSATNAMFSGPETYIFGCNENGENVLFSELPGSFRGSLNIEQALYDAGYELII